MTTMSAQERPLQSSCLRPTVTMAEIYGPNHVYAPRAHPATCGWLTHDQALLDSLTGNQLSIVGNMAVVCSAGSVTPAAIELMALAGLDLSQTQLHPFVGEHDAVDTLHRLATAGKTFVVQHVYPNGVLPTGAMWVDAHVLSYLNNKANLGALVTPEYLPLRRIVTPESAFGGTSLIALPVVLKAATDDSTGGGGAVAVCRTKADIDAAAAGQLMMCQRLVVEEFLDIVQSPCLHFAVMPDQEVRYLGFAEQDVADDGRYQGNWIPLGGAPLPDDAVSAAMNVVRRGAELGFRGIVGIDLAMTRDGRTFVIDLNFRVNGSTTAVLMAPGVRQRVGDAVLHLRKFVGTTDIATLLSVAGDAVRRGRFIPFASFDPDAAGRAGTLPRISGIVIGESQGDVLATERELAARGMK